jgi:hypothetical protein
MMSPHFAAVLAAATLALAGCDRGSSSAADTTRAPGATTSSGQTPPTTTADVGSAGAPASAAASAPPSGMTNPSTAAQGTDLSNSTRATGNSNVYQPPSTDNPAPVQASAGVASGAASATGQSTSSQTLGTSPPPNDGTLPGGTTGSTGSRRGGGKS